MKRIISYLISILILGLAVLPAEAYHNFFFRDAGDITSGILANQRLDSSSVTLQGNHTSFSTITAEIANLKTSTNNSGATLAELLITTPIFESRLDDLDTSTATLTTAIKSTAAALTLWQNAVNASTATQWTSLQSTWTALRSNLNNVVSSNITNGTIIGDDISAIANVVVSSLNASTVFTTTGSVLSSTIVVNNLLHLNGPTANGTELRIQTPANDANETIASINFKALNDGGGLETYFTQSVIVSSSVANFNSVKVNNSVKSNGGDTIIMSLYGDSSGDDATVHPQVSIKNLTVGDVTSVMSSALDVVSGSVTIRGANGGINLNGANSLIRFPDGTTQNTAATAGGTDYRAYSIVIATGSSMGADVVGTDHAAFNSAISSLTPNGGTILVRRGRYTATSAINTIPWNVTLLCEGGAEIANTGNITVFVNSGTVDGCTFLPAGGITTQFMTLNDSSTVKNVIVKDADMGAGGAVFDATDKRNIFMDRVQSYNNRDAAAWVIGRFVRSQDIILQRGYNRGNATGSDYLYDLQGSSRVIFKDMIHLDDAGDAMISLAGGINTNILITGCIAKSVNTTSIGLIYGSAKSTGVVVTNNYFQGNSNASSRAVNPQDQTEARNWVVTNNVFDGFGSAGVFIPAAGHNWFLHGNRTTNGVFLSDSGTNTLKRDNMLQTNALDSDS